MEFGLKHCFFSLLYFGKRQGFYLFIFLFDTKFTLNFRSCERQCVYLVSFGPVRYSSNYLTMPFLAGVQSNVSDGVPLISSEYSVNSTSLHFSNITVNLLCLYINICLILQLFSLTLFSHQESLGYGWKTCQRMWHNYLVLLASLQLWWKQYAKPYLYIF